MTSLGGVRHGGPRRNVAVQSQQEGRSGRRYGADPVRRGAAAQASNDPSPARRGTLEMAGSEVRFDRAGRHGLGQCAGDRRSGGVGRVAPRFRRQARGVRCSATSWSWHRRRPGWTAAGMPRPAAATRTGASSTGDDAAMVAEVRRLRRRGKPRAVRGGVWDAPALGSHVHGTRLEAAAGALMASSDQGVEVGDGFALARSRGVRRKTRSCRGRRHRPRLASSVAPGREEPAR